MPRRLDPLSRLERSHQMALVKGRDTSPERAVRRALSRLGYRYRLHSPRVPGKPDIVLARLRKVIFVHGCFWHRHHGCARTRVPKTRVSFWERKFEENVVRDRSVRAKLARAGWRSLVVWECVSEKPVLLERRLLAFLGRSA
jgi:DNA mismatch endonuclease (patch repair protein)